VQIVPAIAPQVASLSVFQRTPAWILPHTDRPITSWERGIYRRVPAAQRAVRTAVYWQRELLASGMAKHPRQMALVRLLASRHLARQVPDPDLRKRLTPQYTPGCKRLVPSNDFYPALLQPHVELVTDPIERLAGRGVVTRPASAPASKTRELDVLNPGHRVPCHRQPGDGPHPGHRRHPPGGRVAGRTPAGGAGLGVRHNPSRTMIRDEVAQ
jgi:cation diffusion facilitator CzcD-associated flavoprotein CzcO